MSTKGADPATSIATAAAWMGVAAFSFWAMWVVPGVKIWFAIPLGLMLALVAGGYAIESLSQELTIRRWAIGQLVFTVFGVVFLVAGIFDANILSIWRWLLFVGAALYLLTAVLCAAAAKELF